MKRFASLHDAEIAFRDLENTVQGLMTRNIDMQKRRVVNAHPSVDADDYVIRRELTQGLKSVVQEPSERVERGDYDVAVFGIAINTEIAIGEDVCPRHIVIHSTGGVIEVAVIDCKTVPVGASIILDAYVGATRLFRITLAAGQSSSVLTTFDEDTLAYLDRIKINVVQVGSSVRGGTLVLKVRYRWL